METLYENSDLNNNLPSLQDLKITIHDSALVFPSQETKKRSMFLSNIDQYHIFDVQTIHFFNANPDFSPQIVIHKLRTALSKVLVAYDFLAGRLKLNHESGRFEIDCNGKGVGFVIASVECSFDEIGDLDYPNPAFRKFIFDKLNNSEGLENQPLLILQVTTFKCGGFVLGVSNNHATFDGISFKIFLKNLASQAFNDCDDDKPLAITPCNDRQLLAARSPPSVQFPHPELIKPIERLEDVSDTNGRSELEVKSQESSGPSLFESSKEQLDYKIFKLTSNGINHLKEKAKSSGGGTKPSTKITSFNVVIAHIWRCKALSSTTHHDDNDRSFSVLYPIDIRPRLNPPLPSSYTGTAVLSAYAIAKFSDLQEWCFSKVVDMISESGTRMTDEYARSVIDWVEIYKGYSDGDFVITSWSKLGFAEVEYPWGKPKYSCPVVSQMSKIVYLLPHITGANNGGLSILVALPTKEMDKFQSLFHKLLA